MKHLGRLPVFAVVVVVVVVAATRCGLGVEMFGTFCRVPLLVLICFCLPQKDSWDWYTYLHEWLIFCGKCNVNVGI